MEETPEQRKTRLDTEFETNMSRALIERGENLFKINQRKIDLYLSGNTSYKGDSELDKLLSKQASLDKVRLQYYEDGFNPKNTSINEWYNYRDDGVRRLADQRKKYELDFQSDLAQRNELARTARYLASEAALHQKRSSEFDKFREMQQRNKDLQGASAGVAKDPYDAKQEGVQVVEQEENQTNVVGGKKPKLNTEQTNRV